MARKHSLPLLHLGRGSLFASPSPGAPDRPSVDAIRRRLGGRASTEPGAGELVEVAATDGAPLRGVILFAQGDHVDVWLEQPHAALSTSMPPPGLVRRARRGDIAPLRAPAPRDLDAVAADARVFGALVEGQRIRYQNDAGLHEGVLIEKCRFGGLVGRDDGVIVGVGFRRIWPTQRLDERRN